MRIAAVGRALPEHAYDQETLTAFFGGLWRDRGGPNGRARGTRLLPRVHRNARVARRRLCVPLETLRELDSFDRANREYVRAALDLGERAALRALRGAGLAPGDVDHMAFASVTGIATPSIDARLMNRLPFRPDLKRTPLFGLGCVAGAAGIARLADTLRGQEDDVALLLAVEVCSVTLQRDDASVANVVATGLFGDGAAAVVMTGDGRPGGGPRVIASRSSLYPDTENVMGWAIGASGFRVVLSARVPEIVRTHLRRDVETFLAREGVGLDEIESVVCHPGGPKVMDAVEETLDLPAGALDLSRRSLREVGNLSSASVLFVLADTIAEARPAPGSLGLLVALGPGFCSELVLLRW